MHAEKAVIAGISASLNSNGRGWIGNYPGNSEFPILRYRRRARSNYLLPSLHLKFGFIAVSLATAFLLVNCARAFAALRLPGTKARSLAEESVWHHREGCGEGDVSPGYDADTSSSGDTGELSSTGSTRPSTPPSEDSNGIPALSEPLDLPSGYTEEQQAEFTYPGAGGPLLIAVPAEPNGVSGVLLRGVFPTAPLISGNSVWSSSFQDHPRDAVSGLYWGAFESGYKSAGQDGLPKTLSPPHSPLPAPILLSANDPINQPLQHRLDSLHSNAAGSANSAPSTGSSPNAPPERQWEAPHPSSEGFNGFGPFGVVAGGFMQSPLVAGRPSDISATATTTSFSRSPTPEAASSLFLGLHGVL